jgi:hypothetical protein
VLFDSLHQRLTTADLGQRERHTTQTGRSDNASEAPSLVGDESDEADARHLERLAYVGDSGSIMQNLETSSTLTSLTCEDTNY